MTTDVIVRDVKNDQFIADLKPTDFEMYEDGVKQELASMVLVHGGRVYNTLAPPPAPLQEGIILPVARPTNDAAGRMFLIIVDDLHMDFRKRRASATCSSKMLKNLIHEGDMFRMVSTGPSSISDRSHLRPRAARRGDQADHRQRPEADRHHQGAGRRRRADRSCATARTSRSRRRTTADAELEKLHNRRKAVIWVSSGYDFNPFEKSRLEGAAPAVRRHASAQTRQPEQLRQSNGRVDPNQKRRVQFADAELVRDWRK